MAIPIVAQFPLPEQVVRAMLLFRRLGQTGYRSIVMVQDGDLFRARIASSNVQPEAVEYYLTFHLRDGRLISHPEQEPELLPHVVFVESQPTAAWLDILYPEPESSIPEKRPEISAAFAPGMVQADAVTVLLDENEVTAECELTDDYLLYTPARELSAGAHMMTVQLRSASADAASIRATWHFEIAGGAPILTRPSGFASILGQWNDATNDSTYLLYDPGTNVDLTFQFGNELWGRPLNVWFSRSDLYQAKDTELSLSLMGERFQLNAGDIFPRFSLLTLDSLPASGAQMDYALNRATFSVVAAQTNFLVGEDAFLSALLKTRFAGGRAEFKLPYQIHPSLSFLYATDGGDTESDETLVTHKRDYVYSGGLDVSLPKHLRVSTEWVRNRKKSSYSSAELDFASADDQSGNAFLLRVGRTAAPLSFELTYQDIGAQFAPEANPFWESGKRGIGASARYTWSLGLSASVEYGRYTQDSDTSNTSESSVTEGSASLNLVLPNYPKFSISLNQQRVPYAAYSLEGASLHASYQISRFRLSGSYSLTQADFWTSDDSRTTTSASGSVTYEIIRDKLMASLNYSGYSSRSGSDLSQERRQIWFTLDYRLTPKHRFQTKLENLGITDAANPENDAQQRGGHLQYDVTF